MRLVIARFRKAEIIAVNIVKMRQAEMPAAVSAAMLDATDGKENIFGIVIANY